MDRDRLVVRGARQNNLRNVDLELPKNQLVVLTGVSGSGKSSLAFDTLYAEGQRRYVESLSSYARQFLEKTPKPDVDSITGLAPPVSIEQRGVGHNPRSTVGTITEIYDYLRVLYAAVGVPHCPDCRVPIGAQTPERILARLLSLPSGARLNVLAPVAAQRKGEYRDLFEDMRKRGYIRARVDGEYTELTADLELDRHRRHDVDVVIDRGVVGKAGFCAESRLRLAEAVEGALKLGEGRLIAEWSHGDDGGDLLLSSEYSCPRCGSSFDPPSHAAFSFNAPQGMCPTCDGLGTKLEIDPDLLIERPEKSLDDGAIPIMRSLRNMWRRHIFEGVAKRYGFTLDTPIKKLTKKQLRALLYGSGRERVEYYFKHPRHGWEWRHASPWEGVVAQEMDRYRKITARGLRKQFEALMRTMVCPECGGARLKASSLAVTIADKSIADVSSMSVGEAQRFFEALELTAEEAYIAEDALKEIRGRLGFLADVGLHYLALDRTAPTLAGGESQRIRLASQVGSGLVGVLYVLDEPSIGLHSRDNARLLKTLRGLRDMGNTVVVVEHDEDTMLAADHIVDFGPGAGEHGGEAVARGPLRRIMASKRSVTGKYLRGELRIPIPEQRRAPNGKVVTVRGARQNNLKGVDVDFPLGVFICVTGVSGSGKSSLVGDILCEALARDLNRAMTEPGEHDAIEGLEPLDKVIVIDQSPIGRTPRSNPATYVGVFDHIRAFFAQLPESRTRGYAPGRFSFNVKGGRCEACEGNGAVKLEMDFLADVWVECEVCGGARFNRETLEITHRGATIADVLAMDIGQALDHFQAHPKIHAMLATLRDVGMDYVRLGQPAPTLSGGEAQRVKLAKELCRRATGRTLYVLDEPTTGLHFADIQKLLNVLHRFVDDGNTVIVVEHNLEVIKTADHIIDLGPEGGEEGGRVVVTGTPEAVAKHKASHTGAALREFLRTDRRAKIQANGKGPKLTGPSRNGKRVEHLTIRGAREHNLKGVDARLPRDKMTVVSGVSGSGKSSLALDTIYAEGQRRYIESLSAYARQFLGQMRKPKVDQVTGLSPAICIEQKPASQSPRSTVGTVTGVYDYLRALVARIGTPYCPDCQIPIGTQTSSQVIDRVLERHDGARVLLLAPVDPKDNEEYADVLERLRREDYLRARVDGTFIDLTENPKMDRRRKHRIELVVDRLTVSSRTRKRVADSVERALDRSGGRLVVADAETGEDAAYSQHFSCSKCHRAFEPLTPRALSFNHIEGWCPDCEGLGTERGSDPNVVIPNRARSLREGAVGAWGPLEPGAMLTDMVEALGRHVGFDLDTPWQDLAREAQDAILYGPGDVWLEARGMRFQIRGCFPAFEEAARLSWHYRHQLGRVIRDLPCRACGGGRLQPVAAAVRLRGLTLPQICDLPLSEALELFEGLDLSPREQEMAGEVIEEVRSRVRFLVDVGLEYVTLNRPAPTLSGGESQRIRLAGQIGSGLTGVLYVLDEPTVGLHPRDNARLLSALAHLRDLGNTLVLVEHDRDTLEAADYILDVGPGAGPHGGEIVAAGPREAVQRKKRSLTGRYLAGDLPIPVPADRRVPDEGCAWLTVVGARHNNLRDITVPIPLGRFVCVTGPSGSGKSSLVHDILLNHLAHELRGARTVAEEHDAVHGIEHIDKVINIDQDPIGRSPRSDPATYTKVFDAIRSVFARLPEARVRGYDSKRFSYNAPGGRCEACWGLGSRCIEMHFLPDVWVECDECHGSRYTPETLEIRYRGKSIADVLAMSVEEALDLFSAHPPIRRTLRSLVDVGLGYMQLGQAAPTLSGGEAQRVKLSRELARPGTGRTLYLLDEPTTGLHAADVDRLLRVLHRLVEAGNTVLVIEHNMEVAKTADWVIDLGPGGGSLGGDLVCAGPPEKVARCKASSTAPFLREALERSPRVPRADLAAAPNYTEPQAAREAVSADTLTPWERDGRAWHLRERTLPDGRRPDWQPEALEFLLESVSAFDGMGEPNWTARDGVTVGPDGTRAPFFVRARTDEYWWFRAEFRTEKGLFDQGDLTAALGIKVWDEITDRQVYGRWSRVRVRPRDTRWDRVELFLYNREEIDTPAFRRFLEECLAGYHRMVANGEVS